MHTKLVCKYYITAVGWIRRWSMQQYEIRSHTKEGIRLVSCSCLLMRHLQRRLWECVMWGEVKGGCTHVYETSQLVYTVSYEIWIHAWPSAYTWGQSSTNWSMSTHSMQVRFKYQLYAQTLKSIAPYIGKGQAKNAPLPRRLIIYVHENHTGSQPQMGH